MNPQSLTDESLINACTYLAERDSDLAAALARWGVPPMWAREPGFPTLVHIILEQQVSLASAQAAFDRLQATLNPVTPTSFLTLDAVTLKGIGFSRQKTAYCRLLAEAIIEDRLDLAALSTAPDGHVFEILTALKGIGPWTASIYLLMVLRRPDIWPRGDIALAVAAAEIKQLPQRPTQETLVTMSLAWQPYRSVAARILWHHYLSLRGK